MDPKQIVAAGYDQIAETYAAWVAAGGGEHRQRHLAILQNELPDGARVLDLGCATGVPVARQLAARYDVTGVDISRRQIELARANVPNATFIQADMATLVFPPASFDAIVAFFSLIHLPREEHAALFERIVSWLRPGGLFVASMGSHSDPGTVEQDWLGAPMYWSFYASDVSLELMQAAGLEMAQASEETADEDGQPVTFLWVVARKPTVVV